ncbi:sialidase family protein [uncultured Aquimarina sp.]|uniref:TolB family protein n=1 Tax=uncultured Aquimarina sp. TaxID=575652 RepID=UPI00261BE417|nr:sialidase family protein [uncultured Aquimarina sp.]
MKSSILKKIIFSFSCIIICNTSIAQDNDCNYFGLSKPKTIPQDFNPEILNLKGSFKFNVEIKKCDEIYFTTIDSKENIYISNKNNGKWSEPKIASFSDPKYSDADPFLTKKGDRIYFISERPTSQNDENTDWNIWYANNENGMWGKPKPLPEPINSKEFDEYFFSISDKGNAFFSSNRADGQGSFDIYTVKVLDNNTFSEPKNVGRPLSTEKYEFDPYISNDESFIIFSINENGNSSLYYSYRNKKNNWTEPQNLGDQINITNQDFAPSLSKDGKFIFYSNNGKLKWVSSEIIRIPN